MTIADMDFCMRPLRRTVSFKFFALVFGNSGSRHKWNDERQPCAAQTKFVKDAQVACFHLSTIRCISAAPEAAASSAVCSPLSMRATILGTTEVLKISI